ncbi:MAG: phosphoethanolamine transferase [Alphaproteobacteria bacterium]|nr:phosphoethanolamine transferase [Alphaproteobacteria bacterium]MDY4690303.1 phosphoethanolamine transferase [Alphaproteobacteria bacterium]
MIRPAIRSPWLNLQNAAAFFSAAKLWWLCFIGFVLFSCALRFLNTQGTFNCFRYSGYALSSAVIFAFNAHLWNYGKKYFVLALAAVILWGGADYMRAFNDMIISERELMQTLSVASIFFGLFANLFWFCRTLKQKPLRLLCGIAAFIFCLLTYFVPLLFLGYSAVSGGKMLSADILMTLFQTNPDEVMDYISEQNQLLWWSANTVLLLGTVLFLVFCFKLNSCRQNCRKPAVITLLLLAYLSIFSLPRLQLNCAVTTAANMKATLKGFAEYQASLGERKARLQELQKILHSSSDGVYMLVLGESTTRDHMHAYGYVRPTTPWLDKELSNPQALIFQNAYSNHVHTIPSLLYILTQQNQYNDIKLKDAYSVIEIAKAAGYQTYWLSNQKKYSVSDTPLTTIAQSADKAHYINDYTGNKSVSVYTDEKLAEFLPDLSHSSKALVIVHLMGCHSLYTDRYTEKFAVFSGSAEKVDTYDNCILHNDYVLEQLYGNISRAPNFMGWFYLSDHGEEPDLNLAHESSKFTFQMSHIPLVMIFSEKFKQQKPDVYKALQEHKNSAWSSDLMFNAMLDILGISGLSEKAEDSIASPEYSHSKNDLLTLHGQMPISKDK